MIFINDEEKDKDLKAPSEEAVGEVLDEDADVDEVASIPLEDDEKAWE